jgi:hypothetical protein
VLKFEDGRVEANSLHLKVKRSQHFWNRESGFDPMRLSVVCLHGQVTDADLTAVRAAGYSETEIVEIIAVTIDNVFTKSA